MNNLAIDCESTRIRNLDSLNFRMQSSVVYRRGMLFWNRARQRFAKSANSTLIFRIPLRSWGKERYDRLVCINTNFELDWIKGIVVHNGVSQLKDLNVQKFLCHWMVFTRVFFKDLWNYHWLIIIYIKICPYHRVFDCKTLCTVTVIMVTQTWHLYSITTYHWVVHNYIISL